MTILCIALLSAGCDQSDRESLEREPTGNWPVVDVTDDTPSDLPKGLLLAYAQFRDDENGKPIPGPARMALLYRSHGAWKTRTIEDTASQVFHKVMYYSPPSRPAGVLTLGAEKASLKLWRWQQGEFVPETLWTADFSGKRSRLRDAEIADIDADGIQEIVIGTHDQGVVAVVRPHGKTDWIVDRLDHQRDTYIHEIEIGDVNSDGIAEIYASASEPNRADFQQPGRVWRYTPARDGTRNVVADLPGRHPKELLLSDMDADGADELYVSWEGLMRNRPGGGSQLVKPVEIRQYDAATSPSNGTVIATIQDRMNRFLTVGIVGPKRDNVLVAASFSSGLWAIQQNNRRQWTKTNLDRDSSGFQHAAAFHDLNNDGIDELYVAADDQKKVRRYEWKRGKVARTVIHSTANDSSLMTWNIESFPLSLIQQDRTAD